MKYVSIDIETTGLDRKRCQVLEVAALIEDTFSPRPIDQLPAFRVLIKNPDELHWETEAKAMHEALMNEFSNPEPMTMFCAPEELAGLFKAFLLEYGYTEDKGRVRIVVAGKNFAGFDREFLNQLPNWRENISISARVLDPAPLYVDFTHDQELPTLQQCKERAGIKAVAPRHDALLDALDVLLVLRKFYS